MKIANTILLSFIAILILFAATTYINYQQAALVNDNAEKLSQSTLLVRNSNRFQRNVINIVSGLRGYLLTDESVFVQAYDSALIENDNILEELAHNLRDNPYQRKLLADIRQLNSDWVDKFAKPLLEAKRISQLSDSARRAFRTLYQQTIINGLNAKTLSGIHEKVSAFTNSEYVFRESQRRELTASIERIGLISFYLTAISLIAGIGIAWFLARHISSRIVEMVTMANDISRGNYEARAHVRYSNEFGQLAKALNAMAETLSQNFALLNRKNQELNQFAHIVSHDIKAPLRGIDNVVTWIEEDHSLSLPAKVREYLDLIKGRIRKAEHILRGVLDYSRVGKEKLELTHVKCIELIHEIMTYVPLNTSIRLEVPEPLPELFTERLALLQVLMNLILNAFKYHDKPDGYVRVYCRDGGTHFLFYVEDNGPGIEMTYHEKIFVIFQTLSDSDSVENTGVGLAIVRKILDDRKLSITLDSAPGRGSTFSFQWPKNHGKTH
ncbi:MAG TPA: ATP-binding protein [Cyclobacteriaceae bacterium]|nr:ATP-binding protein [Cyclobacteriaceae bacterium]